MKIAVINIYNFPVGMAPTTRIIGYCKGLLQTGAKVDIISIVPKKESDKDEPLFGVCDGGNYYHFAYAPSCNIPILRSVAWRVRDYLSQKRALAFIKESDRKEPYDAVIMSFDEPSRFEAIVPTLGRLQKAKVIAIADEYPIPIRHYLKPSVPESKLKRYRAIYQYIDGRILMTAKLQNFYDTNVCPKPTLILSTIVDIDRFKDLVKEEQERDYLCYMGNMELSKDNVDNIIEAFALVADKYLDIDFHLFGTPKLETKQYLERIISKHCLQNRVFLKGRVDYDKVPQILKNAKVLVSSQPNTKRAEGGFPTKLGEYMMTGVPALLTDVGEIADYVKDGINGYLVTPENPQRYAERLSYILDNYLEAIKVAEKAKYYVINNISMTAAGNSIINYLTNTHY